MGQQQRNLEKAKLYLAIMLFIVMIGAVDPWATGIPFHEWASFLLIIPLILIHIQIDWQWIVAVSKRAFKKQPGQTRFNYYWDWLLFFMITTVSVSGIVISEAVLPLFGIKMDSDPFWSMIHTSSAVWLMVMLGVHITMHRKWIIKIFKSITYRKPFQNIHRHIHGLSEILSMTKKSMLQIIIIVLAGLVISYVVFLLDDTQWADHIRGSFNETGQPDASQEQPHIIIRIVSASIFISGKMVFGALITIGILGTRRLIKRV